MYMASNLLIIIIRNIEKVLCDTVKKGGWYLISPPGPGGGTLGISGRGCAAGTKVRMPPKNRPFALFLQSIKPFLILN